jgi:hypothetical protein
MKEDILGYLLDALEPHEQDAIEKRIEQDPAFREEVEASRRLTFPLARDDHIEPPPGLAARTLAFTRTTIFAAAANDWAEARSRMRPIDFAVAAGILCVAAMLVFPAIATIRGDQARVLCAEQLRNLGVALAMYAEQESDRFPYVDATGPMNNAGIFAVLLKSRELITDGRALVCPSANSAVALIPEVSEYLEERMDPSRVANLRRNMAGSYGYVLGYQQDGTHRGFTFRNDSRPVMSDRPPRLEELLHFMNSPNHQDRGQNVLYADGNVRWLPSRIFGRDDLFLNQKCEVGAGIGLSDIVIGVSESTPYPHIEL